MGRTAPLPTHPHTRVDGGGVLGGRAVDQELESAGYSWAEFTHRTPSATRDRRVDTGAEQRAALKSTSVKSNSQSVRGGRLYPTARRRPAAHSTRRGWEAEGDRGPSMGAVVGPCLGRWSTAAGTPPRTQTSRRLGRPSIRF